MSTMPLTHPEIPAIPAAIFPVKTYTPEALAKMPDGDSYELVDGGLVERNVRKLSSFVAMELAAEVRGFVKPRNLGWVFGADLGYKCFPMHPNQVRKPDASFVKRERMP